jgi:glycosyltransferase involved in cell wall biosynthesis
MTKSADTQPVDTSVIIPVYEQPKLLREALESVKNQTYDNYEVLVVDDNSAADMAAVTDEFSDIRFCSHDRNRGAGAARNTGIEAACGEYVAFLDADDTWKPSKLEKQHRVFESGGDELGLVYTGFVQYETDGSEWTRYPEMAGNIYIEELERDRVHPTSTVMVRHDVLDEVGGFDASLPSRQDYDLWIRITDHYEVDYVDEILVDKREQRNSISKDFDSRIVGDLAVFEKVNERASGLDFKTRSRILSYHHHVIGRDYESNDDRWQALKHLGLAILLYPFRPVSWAMFVIALFGIDRNGRLLTTAKQFVR